MSTAKLPAPELPTVEVDALYQGHHGWLYGWLRRKLGNAFDAADLAHDTYLRVMQSGRLPQPQQSRAFLAQVANGLMIDMHRRRLLEQAYQDALSHQPQAHAPSPESQAIVVESLLRIDRALQALAPRVRETFLLSQLDGLTYSAIAAQLNISVGSVRKYMLKAAEACLQALASEAPSAPPVTP